MRLVAYISDFTRPPEEARSTVDAIMAVAKARNAREGITGALFFVNGRFVQILEGPDTEIETLMTDIKTDPRHTGLTILIDTAIEQRGFAAWSMELFYLEEGKRFDTETLALLTSGFMKSQLMRSDVLAYYYKAALNEGAR